MIYLFYISFFCQRSLASLSHEIMFRSLKISWSNTERKKGLRWLGTPCNYAYRTWETILGHFFLDSPLLKLPTGFNEASVNKVIKSYRGEVFRSLWKKERNCWWTGEGERYLCSIFLIIRMADDNIPVTKQRHYIAMI